MGKHELIAELFLMEGIQEWGQPDEKRIEATQQYITAAGFNATATCSPVFGGILPHPFEGPEGDAATEWLRETLKGLRRGKFETEVDQLTEALRARALLKATESPTP